MKFYQLKVIGISHFQSCTGSVYIHSLLDGHPQLCSIPGIINLLPIIFGNFTSAVQALEVFEQANPKFYDTSLMTTKDDNNAGLFNLGEFGDEGIQTNRKVFVEFFHYHMSNELVTPRNVIYSIYYAYSMAHKLDIEKYKFLLLHPHSKYLAFSLNTIFTEMLHFIPIRDPMRAYSSEIKLRRERDESRSRAYSPRGQLVNIAANLYPYYKKNLNFLLLKVEDLGGKNQEQFLSLLASKLDIDYYDSLKCSTFMGKAYWGANPSHRTKSFDAKRHMKPLQLKRYEIVIFSIINHKYLKAVDYPLVNLTFLERIFAILYLLIPLQEEFHWFIDAFYKNSFKNLSYGPNRVPFSKYKHFLGLVYDRLLVFYYFFRNMTTQHYKNIPSRHIKFK